MAADVDVVNYGLVLIGEARITALSENTKAAREASAIFAVSRDALLAAHNWRFAMARTTLNALAIAPVFGYDRQFQLPEDCLRPVFIGEYYAGLDLGDYRGSQDEVYTIEGRQILTSLDAPLRLQYVKRVTQAALFDPCFVAALGARLGAELAISLTGSSQKKNAALADMNRMVIEAGRVNAIQQPPQKLPDDEWVMSRL